MTEIWHALVGDLGLPTTTSHNISFIGQQGYLFPSASHNKSYPPLFSSPPQSARFSGESWLAPLCVSHHSKLLLGLWQSEVSPTPVSHLSSTGYSAHHCSFSTPRSLRAVISCSWPHKLWATASCCARKPKTMSVIKARNQPLNMKRLFLLILLA